MPRQVERARHRSSGRLRTWLVGFCVSVLAGEVGALPDCVVDWDNDRSKAIYELKLPAGQNERICDVGRFVLDGLPGRTILGRFSPEEDAGNRFEWTVEIRADLEIDTPLGSDWELLPQNDWSSAPTWAFVTIDGGPIVGFNRWQYRQFFLSAAESTIRIDVGNKASLHTAVAGADLAQDFGRKAWALFDWSDKAASGIDEGVSLGKEVLWEHLTGEQKQAWVLWLLEDGWMEAKPVFPVKFAVRRVIEGCWVTGAVTAPQAAARFSGDYAFWSDNPTGLFAEDTEEMASTEEEAQEALEGIAALDPEKLAAIGLDLGQVQAAVAQAQKAAEAEMAAAEVEKIVAGPSPTQSLAEELAQFEGSIFLTLQSVKGDDDLRGKGKFGGAVAHILSQVALTFELDEEGTLGDEELKGMLDALPRGQRRELEDKGYRAPVVRRAGLSSRGLIWRYPDEGAPTPLVLVKECPGGGTQERGALCGKVIWNGVAEADFQAGPGTFSCINN